jgi:hypothetical protein
MYNNTYPKTKNIFRLWWNNKILKACASLISHRLSYSYNRSLYIGIFPVLQLAYFIINVFSTVLEKAMYIRLSQHVRTSNILVTEQYDFRKETSTDDAAFRLIDGVFKSIKQNMHVGGIFLWFGKGFWLCEW